MKSNLLLLTDSYKQSHYKQYPPGTQSVYSYLEARQGGAFPEVLWFGLQYYLKEYLEGEVADREKLAEAEEVCAAHFQIPALFNKAGWQHIIDRHGGKLPVTIKAVPEGTLVPLGNVLMTIENTDPACYWLPNSLETLLVQCWYGSTVATQSREMRKIIVACLRETGDPGLVDFKLHDFGFRGVSSVESAGVGGCAHLISFRGTDTMAALTLARRCYHSPRAGFSIPAAEHSTIVSWGRDHEVDAYRNMLRQYPTGLVAVVSDSYDIHAAVTSIWGGALKQEVLDRDGTVVVRPDSGDPPAIVVQVVQGLARAFGCEKNSKGYFVLHPKVRVIQGDGIDLEMIGKVLAALKKHQWSADNVSFGSGGGLLQKLNRDTLRFAFKCSSVRVDGVDRDVFKEPKTDAHKNSKRGRMKLVRGTDGKLHTCKINEPGEDELVEVFRNGVCLRETTLEEIRRRSRSSDVPSMPHA
jgi:nicotinamide phosphoribosyltransferase